MRHNRFLAIAFTTSYLAGAITGCATGPTVDVRDQTATASQPIATGVVYDDANRNGKRDPFERGLYNIGVSNGRDIVRTDVWGRYALPIDNDTIVFVIKPSGWMTPVNEHNLPRFHYIYKPDGSPDLRYPGVEPTGPLPQFINFPLHRTRNANRFRLILFGDPQPYTDEEVFFIAHDVVEELVGFDAVAGVTLGDIVGDDLDLFEPLNAVVRHVGVPWYNVLGNHDINFDALDDRYSDETYERVYGPACYSFNYGKVHFIVLDDVAWERESLDENGKYHGEIGERQLAFVENDLAYVPNERLVVLMMHIPLQSVVDRDKLFALIEDRRGVLAISAHHHVHQNDFFGEDRGWHGHGEFHEIVNVTVSGSWWKGHRDEENIPHTTMRDGAPNGYSIITFEGNDYSVRYKAARRPEDHQMTIFAPDEVSAAAASTTEVLVNVFAASKRSTVEMRLGDSGRWIPMTLAEREDPYYLILKDAEPEDIPGNIRLPNSAKSTHLWAAHLPVSPPAGTHLIHIRTTDMFGQTYTDQRIIRIK